MSVAQSADASADRTIGRILLDSGLITTDGAERALRLHREDGVRFGEACVKLGLVSEADIQRALASQYDYPYLNPGEGKLDPCLIAAYQPFSREVESLRALRTQLLLRWFSHEHRALAIVSPDRNDGRSYLAANLAIVFSQLGEKTLLIDCDFRSPRLHAMFNLPNQEGLSAILSGRGATSAIKRVQPFANLSVLNAGPQPPNPQELISRAEFRDLIAHAEKEFDIVLVDTPAASAGADMQAIVLRTRGALIVLREGRTSVSDARSAARQVAEADAQLVGSVLNKH